MQNREIEFVSANAFDEIPLPICEMELAINGHPFFFQQSRRWCGNVMWVTLTPMSGEPNILAQNLNQSYSWKCTAPELFLSLLKY